MKVSIMKLSGDLLDLDVDPVASVLVLQHHAESLYPRRRIKLALSGQVLIPASTLAESGVEAGALINIIVDPSTFFVLTLSDDRTAKLWSIETGLCIQTFAGHAKSLRTAVFSRDGTFVLTSSFDGTAKVWSTETGVCTQTFAGHTCDVRSAVFSGDGTLVLTSSMDGTAKLWCTETGLCTQTFACHSAGAKSAVFSGDEALVLTVPSCHARSNANTDDYTAKLWSIETGLCTQTFAGHAGYVTSALFSGDGTLVLTSSMDSTAKLWKLETGLCIRTFAGHTAPLESAVLL